MEQLTDVFRRIMAHLTMLVENGQIDTYDRHFLISMTVKVVENLAEKFENVLKGVKEVMVGTGIDYMSREEFYRRREEALAKVDEEARAEALAEVRAEARAEALAEVRAEARTEALAEVRAEARTEALAEVRAEGALQMCISMLKKGIITLADAAMCLEMPEEMLKSYL